MTSQEGMKTSNKSWMKEKINLTKNTNQNQASKTPKTQSLKIHTSKK